MDTMKWRLSEKLTVPALFAAVAICSFGSQYRVSAETPLPRYRAIHLGGNWGYRDDLKALPEDHFSFLKDLNANWVGISVQLHYQGSTDSTVERTYTGVRIPTLTDEVLVNLIRRCKKDGHRVYLTLALGMADGSEHSAKRWQLGDANMPNEDPKIRQEYWPWSLTHPNHGSFVAQFWDSYTKQAVYFAKIAENEKVDLFSLGTETERLFRTRAGGRWKNHFGDELKALVRNVRSVYRGKLTYDMHCDALTSDFYAAGSNSLWDDLGLDVVGVSAYFKLAKVPSWTVGSVESYKRAWERIFFDYLEPLKKRNPKRPVLFLEFGYTDSVRSPYEPNAQAFSKRIVEDSNHNGVDDGEETQANIYAAFFDVMDSRPGIVQGAFLWDNFVISDEHWSGSFASLRGMSVRGKKSQAVVRSTYGKWAATERE